MRWLCILAIVLGFAQQPAEPPKYKGAAEANRAENTAHDKKTEGNQAQTGQPAPAPTQAPVATISQGHPVTANDHTGTGKQQTADEDRATQRKLTWFTGILALVGVLQLVVMFLTWRVYRRQAYEMRRQRHEMRRQRYVMLRQWRAMRAQIGQMESTGKQTDELVKHAGAQVSALNDAAKAAQDNAGAAADNAKAAKASADAFIHSQRPWLALNVAMAGPVVFDHDHSQVRFPFAITVRNVGQMPAMGVWVNAAIFLPSPKKHDVSEERRKICENLRGITKLGQTIFPGVEPAAYHITVVTPMSEIETTCREIFGGLAEKEGMFVPFAILVAAYRTGIDKDAFYYTAHTYEVMRREGAFTLAMKRETTPLEALQLVLYFNSGITAE